MSTLTPAGQLRSVIAAEQIQKRVREMARQISDDYRGQTIHALAVLENGFMFLADLVRALDVPVVCTFIKPKYSNQTGDGASGVLEIFFSHQLVSGISMCCWWRGWFIRV
jgi:hypoxanthine-guanine phosphoribosyltransferase